MNKERLRGLAAQERAGVRKNAERLLLNGTDSQRAAAQQALADLAELDAEERAELSERVSGMDQAQRVIEAFRVMPMTETERKLVAVLLDNPGSPSSELSAAMGWDGQIWHLKFGEMCKARESYLWPAEPSELRNANFWSGILATYGDTSDFWTMKPEAAEAFAAMGIRARTQSA